MKSKFLFFAALVSYIVALNLGPEHPWWALAAFIVSLLLAIFSGESREYEAIEPQAILIIYGGLLLLGLFLVREGIRDNKENYRFSEYLEVHRCEERGVEVTGYTELEHDRFSGESGGDEIKEMIYYCRATGRILSRSEFDSGYFGEPPE